MRNLIIILLLTCTSFTYNINVVEIESNVIFNPSGLNQFVNSLGKLEDLKQQKVRIVHIGDSHIQADYLTGNTRKLFQNRFGNAGRGFVFPYRLAKSWGPLDVAFNHNGYWNTCNILKSYNSCNIGASGFTVSGANNSEIQLKVSNDDFDYSFNRIQFFNKYGAFLPINGTGQILDENNRNVLLLDESCDSIAIQVNSENGSLCELQGMILENESPGILYNTLGVNGSAVLQYLRSSFEDNIADMQPDLIIVSFGTNDCYIPSSRFCSQCTKDRFQELIVRLKESNPSASILITTPPDHFWKRSYSNTNLPKLRDALYELAMEQDVALWDLNTIMGGKNSIRTWANESLARRDLIHFTAAGYELQGELLYDALMSVYENGN